MVERERRPRPVHEPPEAVHVREPVHVPVHERRRHGAGVARDVPQRDHDPAPIPGRDEPLARVARGVGLVLREHQPRRELQVRARPVELVRRRIIELQRGQRRVDGRRRRELVLRRREELLELRRPGALGAEHPQRRLRELAQIRVPERRLHGAQLRVERPVRVPRPHPRERRLRLVALRDPVEHPPERARRRREQRLPVRVERVRLVERRERLSELHQPVVQPHLVARGLGGDVVDLHVGEGRVERAHQIAAPPSHRAHLRERALPGLRRLRPGDGRQHALVHVVRVLPFGGRMTQRLEALPASILGERRRPEPIAQHPVQIVAERGGGAGLPCRVDRVARSDAGDGEDGTEPQSGARKREARTTTFHVNPRRRAYPDPDFFGGAGEVFSPEVTSSPRLGYATAAVRRRPGRW